MSSRTSIPVHASRRALSIYEVLIVVSVIAFLLAMMVPGLSAARQKTWDVTCMNNLHQWGAALHYYRFDYDDYLPTEGHNNASGVAKSGTWYNELPPYLDLPAYRDIEGANVQIREFPNVHLWVCPAKNATRAYKSNSGMNMFHYGMNQVLDGLGAKEPSRDTPGFKDEGDDPIRASRFMNEPNTVYLFDTRPNSPGGTPRNVATMYQRDWLGNPVGRFHGDRANLLLLSGVVKACNTDDLVTDRNFARGEIRWHHPDLYWGYRPPSESEPKSKAKSSRPVRPTP